MSSFTVRSTRDVVGTTASALVVTTRAGRALLDAVEIATHATADRADRLRALNYIETHTRKTGRKTLRAMARRNGRGLEPSVATTQTGYARMDNPAYALFVHAVEFVDTDAPTSYPSTGSDVLWAAYSLRRQLRRG